MHWKPELVIFDCDGVLIDSEILASRIEVEELCRHGCKIALDRYLDLALGRTEEEVIWHEIAEDSGTKLPSNFVEKTREKVARAFERELTILPGVEQVLTSLRIPKCVASGSRLERLQRNLRITHLDRFFDGNIFSATQVSRGKPFPDLFLFVASQMAADPSHCLVIEDSIAGVTGACAAGMKVLGFTGATHCGPRHGEKLLYAGSTGTFEHMDQFKEAYSRLVNGSS